jgi:hypothetical protein
VCGSIDLDTEKIDLPASSYAAMRHVRLDGRPLTILQRARSRSCDPLPTPLANEPSCMVYAVDLRNVYSSLPRSRRVDLALVVKP